MSILLFSICISLGLFFGDCFSCNLFSCGAFIFFFSCLGIERFFQLPVGSFDEAESAVSATGERSYGVKLQCEWS